MMRVLVPAMFRPRIGEVFVVLWRWHQDTRLTLDAM
jgi:hypothetical protein